jgi:hypothetical protein
VARVNPAVAMPPADWTAEDWLVGRAVGVVGAQAARKTVMVRIVIRQCIL